MGEKWEETRKNEEETREKLKTTAIIDRADVQSPSL